MDSIFAFIDESGNHDLNVEKIGASDYFIVVAIILNGENLIEVSAHAENIRKEHFQTGEMKSSGIKGNDQHQRRIRILSDILQLDFKFYVLAVKKSEVIKDSGLRHKQSFFKFFNGLLYNQLFQSHAELNILADEHGDKSFIESFKKYIDVNHKPDLFWKSDVGMTNSKSNVLIQLADFVVGSLAQVYESKGNPALQEVCLRLINEKALHIIEWPTKYQTHFSPPIKSEEFDSLIYRHSLAQAEVFINENDDAFDIETKLQTAVLRHLVFVSRFDAERSYIATHEILEHLRYLGFADITEQAIRSTIIAKLRDRGVLISSCNRGYKIPKNYEDLIDFVNRVNGLVLPLIERLRKARNSYLRASLGKTDLLTGTNYPDLVAFIEHLDKFSLPRKTDQN